MTYEHWHIIAGEYGIGTLCWLYPSRWGQSVQGIYYMVSVAISFIWLEEVLVLVVHG